jgi:hypothetical protein
VLAHGLRYGTDGSWTPYTGGNYPSSATAPRFTPRDTSRRRAAQPKRVHDPRPSSSLLVAKSRRAHRRLRHAPFGRSAPAQAPRAQTSASAGLTERRLTQGQLTTSRESRPPTAYPIGETSASASSAYTRKPKGSSNCRCSINRSRIACRSSASSLLSGCRSRPGVRISSARVRSP